VTDPTHATTQDHVGEPAVLAAGVVTLVEGSSFCISGRTGDMDPGSPQGMFFRDTRIVSTWKLRVGGQAPQPLAVMSDEPYHARFLARVPPRRGRYETDLLLERDRYVGEGLREDLRLRNVGPQPIETVLTLTTGADFADLFEVKEGRVRARGELSTTVGPDGPRYGFRYGQAQRGVRIVAPGASVREDGLEFRVRLAPHSDWHTTVLAQPSVDAVELPGTFPVGSPLEHSSPARRLRQWRAGAPRIAPRTTHCARRCGKV
jgi:hypothetical protein